MKKALSLEAEIAADGSLYLELPPEFPRGRVVLTLELVPDDDFELTSEDVQGLGLTAEEIAKSPEIGAWADDPEIPSGAEYVETIRRRRPRYSW